MIIGGDFNKARKAKWLRSALWVASAIFLVSVCLFTLAGTLCVGLTRSRARSQPWLCSGCRGKNVRLGLDPEWKRRWLCDFYFLTFHSHSSWPLSYIAYEFCFVPFFHLNVFSLRFITSCTVIYRNVCTQHFVVLLCTFIMLACFVIHCI